jgi:iron complex transport system permease protein
VTVTRQRRPTSARHRPALFAWLLVAVGGLALAAAASVALGARDVGLGSVVQALLDPTPNADVTVIREMRVPRTLLGMAVGAALALGGTLLQGVARNPLADPGVMGINSGAAAAVAISVLAVGSSPAGTQIWFAFAGAAIATVFVYSVASVGREGATPVKLALAGAAVTALCASVTSAIVLSDPDALDQLRMWQVGSLGGRNFEVLDQLVPYFLAGSAAALFTGRALNMLSLGDDLARSFGVRVSSTRALVFAIVTVLCGAATAACGPIVFVGLLIPHLARAITGPDYRWILAYSLVLGPILVLACDILGRVIAPSGETPVGVVVGIIGAPVFVALVRYRQVAQI